MQLQSHPDPLFPVISFIWKKALGQEQSQNVLFYFLYSHIASDSKWNQFHFENQQCEKNQFQ